MTLVRGARHRGSALRFGAMSRVGMSGLGLPYRHPVQIRTDQNGPEQNGAASNEGKQPYRAHCNLARSTGGCFASLLVAIHYFVGLPFLFLSTTNALIKLLRATPAGNSLGVKGLLDEALFDASVHLHREAETRKRTQCLSRVVHREEWEYTYIVTL